MDRMKAAKARRLRTNKIRKLAGLEAITTPIKLKPLKRKSSAEKMKISKAVKLSARRRKSRNIKRGDLLKTKMYQDLKAMQASAR